MWVQYASRAPREGASAPTPGATTLHAVMMANISATMVTEATDVSTAVMSCVTAVTRRRVSRAVMCRVEMLRKMSRAVSDRESRGRCASQAPPPHAVVRDVDVVTCHEEELSGQQHEESSCR